MKKFVCTGNCHGESDKPGVCQAPDCNKHGEPLVDVGTDVLEQEIKEAKPHTAWSTR